MTGARAAANDNRTYVELKFGNASQYVASYVK